jgi:tetratricopeptide (TPR) repeat protein
MRAWIAGICLVLAMGPAGAQNADLSRANTLYLEGKKIEALPLYEQLAREHPGEWLYFERLADCLAAKSAQTEDPAEATAIRTEMRDAAKKAVELGDPNRYLQVMAGVDPSRPLLPESTSPGSALLKEAEKAYGAGNFTLALEKYTAAYEADPKLYNAALFAGDTAYVQKDLKTAALWFARAIAIDPDRETAYRYWGDAILRLGNDPIAARQKFIDAVVAEPYNRMSWQGIEQWAQVQEAVVLAPNIDRPAAPKVDKDKPNTTNIVIDINSLDDKKNPGGFAWMMYSMIRATYHGDTFKKDFPDEKEYRHSLKEEEAALSVVASTVEEKKIKPSKLDESLRNLVELHKAGMLECWILINGADEGIAQDYPAYRKEHRQLLHDYLDRFVIHGSATPYPLKP